VSPARTTTADRTQPGGLVLLCLAAWAIPGLGHLWLGRRSKGLIFLVSLPLMFVIGLLFQGRMLPFDFTDPVVGLGAVAQFGIGLLFFLVSPFGYGRGDVRAVSYEYGNTFLIVAGLLNLLVVLDAYDVAVGRK
jgi:hypothetical protein